MSDKPLSVSLKLALNHKTNRIEVSLGSESKPDDINAFLSQFLRIRQNGKEAALDMVQLQTVDPTLSTGPGTEDWILTTCDIIK